MASRRAFVTLPRPLADRIERVRLARAAGRELPPLSAVLREAVSIGLATLESPRDVEIVSQPRVKS